jgi:hypothetical protein
LVECPALAIKIYGVFARLRSVSLRDRSSLLKDA